MISLNPAVAEPVDAYVHGWALSRGAPRPVPVEHGWYVPTGTATEPERFVLTNGTLDDVHRVRKSLTKPGSCLKFAGDREDWLSLVDGDWEENPVGWFMTREVTPSGQADPPLGRLSRAEIGDGVALVELEYCGRIVASGRAGLWEGWAVPDRIRTSPDHRRRGLGRFVMRQLLSLAHEAGARDAILDASTDGRELYRALGWATVAGQFGINRPLR